MPVARKPKATSVSPRPPATQTHPAPAQPLALGRCMACTVAQDNPRPEPTTRLTRPSRRTRPDQEHQRKSWADQQTQYVRTPDHHDQRSTDPTADPIGGSRLRETNRSLVREYGLTSG